MSMIGNFRISSDDEIRSLLNAPDSITSLLYPDSDESEQVTVEIDVDKAWHGIHFLLCRHAWEGDSPLNFVVCGGAPVGDVDVGYGPARVFTVEDVVGIAQALEPITSAELRTRFNAKEFFDNDIYPEIWNEKIEVCLDGYVLSYFDKLKNFILKAKAEKKGLIVYIN